MSWSLFALWQVRARRTLPGRRIVRAGLAALVLSAGPSGAAEDFSYVVQAGDNPWNLTERFLKGMQYWPQIQRRNHIADATHIRPGTVLRVPREWLRLTATSVRLVAVSGAVTSSRAQGPATPAPVGLEVLAGMHLRTGSQASATLQFGDGTRVLLLPDTELALNAAGRLAAGAGSIVQIELLRGSLENLVHRLSSPEDRFEIQTPAAVAAVRGTEFRVSAGPSSARTEVLGGVVAFGNSAGDQTLPAGFGSVARPGTSPSAPAALLPAPELAALPRLLERLPLTLTLPPQAGAVAFRLQLAPDEGFTTLADDRSGGPGPIRLGELADGDYRLRLRGIDAAGLEGYAGQSSLTIHAHPEPPIVVAPAPQAVLDEGRPTLRWTAGASGTRYHLQLARRPELDDALVDQPALDQPAFQLTQDLPPGTYYWRLAALDSNGHEGPFSDLQQFRCRAVPPGLLPAELGQQQLTLRWRGVDDGRRYRLQLDADPGFSAPQLDVVLPSAQYSLAAPVPGSYSVRVQAIAADGEAGDWSSAQTLVVPAPPPPPPPQAAPWWLLLLMPLLTR